MSEEESLKQFLKVLFHNLGDETTELIEVRLLGDVLPLQPKFYASIDLLLEEFPAIKNVSYNIYFGVCPRIRRKGTKKDVSRANVLWLDLDDRDFKGGAEEILKKLNEFLLRPTIVVRTGHGFHAYWLLKEPERNKQLVETYLKALAAALGADKSSCEIARVLRLPGTFNRKDKANPLPVKIVWLEESAYCLSDFDFVLDSTPPSGPENTEPSEGSIKEGSRNSALTSIGGALRRKGVNPDALQAILETANNELCQPPLSDEEVRRITHSLNRYSPDPKSDLATYKNDSVAEPKWLTARQISEKNIPDIQWVYKGYIALGMTTLFSSRPKTGKTTFVFHFLKCHLQNSSFLGIETARIGKVLLLSEEPMPLIKRRIERLGLIHDDFLVLSRFDVKDWADALVQVRYAIDRENVRFVIVDTVAAFWGAIVENDAPDIIQALQPLQAISQEKNIAVLLIHHLRKMGGEDGTAHRGSGALLGAVDIALELYKSSSSKTRRDLKSMSRFEETPPEIMIELKEDVYEYLGTPSQVEHAEVRQRVIDALPGPEEDPINRNAVAELLDPKPSMSLLKEILSELVREEKIEQHGKGAKGSPYLYRKKPTQNQGGQI